MMFSAGAARADGICCLAKRSIGALTFHDGYVHGPPTRARYAAEARPVGDGWTTSAGYESSPAATNKGRAA